MIEEQYDDFNLDNYSKEDENEDLEPEDQEALAEDVKNSILLAIEDIGKFQIVNDIEIFVKGSNAEGAIKSLESLLRKDTEIRPIVRDILGQWGIMQKKLLPLLAS